MITIGNPLIADAKMMYYPTQEFETYRLLGMLGKIYIHYYALKEIEEKILGKELYNELYEKARLHKVSKDVVIYDYWLQTEQYNYIKQYCKISFGHNKDENITVADLFAGKGRWLDCFNETLINKQDYSSNIITIANEIEENRYDNIPETITEKYNTAFETLQLPQNSIALMLYNPPYSSSNGERNCKRYLRMIIERKLMFNPQQKDIYKVGYMAFVIRKDDFLDSLDLIITNFDVLIGSIHRTDIDEYNKFKQYVFVARLKKYPYDLKNTMNAMDFQKEYIQLKDKIESDPEFELPMYNISDSTNYPTIDYDFLKENFEETKQSDSYISNDDSIWKWIKDITELKNLDSEVLTVPKSLKIGEISNIIASGYINGELDLNGIGKHVVVGGTKKVEKKEITTYKDDKGDKITETKIIKMSQPYLNILCSIDNELKIIELGDSE